MKKLLSVILIVLCVFTGCGTTETLKTEDELRAEVEAELEAEAKLKEELKAEVEAELEAEQEQDKTTSSDNNNQNEVNKTTVKSENKSFEEVYADDLEVAIDYFNEHIDGFTDDEKNTFTTEILEELNNMYNGLYESLGGEGIIDIPMAYQPLMPVFDDELYTSYSFSTNEFNINSFDDEAIKDNYKTLRDNKYFTLGLSIWAMEGYLDMPGFKMTIDKDMYAKLKPVISAYIEVNDDRSLSDWIPNMEFDTVESVINNTSISYPVVLIHDFSEVEQFKDKETWKTTLILPVNFVEKEERTIRTDVYYQDDLIKGVSVSDKFRLADDFIYETNGYTQFISMRLECDDYVKATFIYRTEYDCFFIRVEEPIFDKNLLLNNPLIPEGEEKTLFREGGTFNVDLAECTIAEEFIAFVRENEYHYLQGSIDVRSIEWGEGEVDGYSELIGTDFTPDDSEFERMQSTSGASSALVDTLTRFTNETLYSLDEETYIDYSKYHLVVIPEQESVNAGSLSSRTVNLTETGNEATLKFSILGEVNSLEFTYYENPLDESIEPQTIRIDGPFSDEIITVKADLPTDFSYVKVTGMYIYMFGVDGFELGLDDARDPASHEIIMKEAMEYND